MNALSAVLLLLVLNVQTRPAHPTIRPGVELLVVDVQVVDERGEPVLTAE